MVPAVLMRLPLFIGFLAFTAATPVLWDGRAQLDYSASQLNTSSGPYLSAVKGTEPATHYTTLLGSGHAVPATPLWSVREQALRIAIDNTSIFTPGSGSPQNGFRRTELIAQSPRASANQTMFDATLEARTSVFHFSLKADEARPLNPAHEYQVVFIEPADGTHVFELQIGTPFNTTPSETSGALKIRSHDLTELFSAPFAPRMWHNFGVVVDWTDRTLAVLYSQNGSHLAKVTGIVANRGAAAGAAGQGDFHFGVLKLPLVDPTNTPEEQADVVHFGIQEGDEERLIYSGVFVEDARDGVSIGHREIVTLRNVL